MSSTEVKKNSKAKANLIAFWEWFKSAAWLQVLLIVGIVVGIVVSIPYIIRAIPTESDSEFFEGRQITYSKFQQFLNGEDTSCNGSVGTGNGNADFSEDRVGFAVIFYKDNCSNCDSMEPFVENWFNTFNEDYSANFKLYTINVGWVPGDSDASSDAEGHDISEYENENISLDDQNDIMQAIADAYFDQPEKYQNNSTSFTRNDVTQDVKATKTTMPTPTVLFYSKSNTETKYDMSKPDKVFLGQMDDLTPSNRQDVNTMLSDLYNITVYQG